jgi:hypothetical protein
MATRGHVHSRQPNPVADCAFAGNWGAGYVLAMSQMPFLMDVLVNIYIYYIFL